MLFKRRNKLPIGSRLLGYLWPAHGWTRAFKYILFRLQRLSGTPGAIAGGFAVGVSVSFSPFVGAHLILCGFLSWLFGLNALAAVLGSLIGNPWTFPFIWLTVYYTGVLIIGAPFDGGGLPDFTALFSNLIESVVTFNWDLFHNDVFPVFIVMLVGCVIYVIVSWFVTYFLLKNFVVKFRALREKRKKIIQLKKLRGKKNYVKEIIPNKLKNIKSKILDDNK